MSKISEHINLLGTCSTALATLSAAWLLALATILWTPVMIITDLVAWSLTDKNNPR
jgi:hypothetical protein